MPALVAAVLTLVSLAPSIAAAQDWPNRPIHFIVPYPAGGSTDIGARAIADHLSRAFGQQVVVENKSGGSGNVGFEFAAKSAPDGYTVLIAPDQVTSAPHVFKVELRSAEGFRAGDPAFQAAGGAGRQSEARRQQRWPN